MLDNVIRQVKWRKVGAHPHPAGVTVLACELIPELKSHEWVFETIHNPTEGYLKLFQYWVPLSELAPSGQPGEK